MEGILEPRDCFTPRLWPGEAKHPVLRIEALGIAVPAYVLPSTLAAGFLLLKLIQAILGRRLLSSPRSATPIQDEKHSADDIGTKKRTANDVENQLPGPEQQRSRALRWLGNALSYYFRIVSLSMLMSIADHDRPFSTWSFSVHPIALLIAAVLSSKTYPGLLYATAAIGWLVSVCASELGYYDSHLTVGMLALAVPCASMYGSPNDEYSGAISAVLLVTREADRHIPTDSLIRTFSMGYQIWPIAMIVFFLLIGAAQNSIYEGSRSGGAVSEKLRHATSDLVSDQLPDLARAGVCAGMVLIPVVLGYVATGFASSCLGWNWLLAGTPATDPTIAVGVGGLISLCVWLALRFACGGGSETSQPVKLVAINEAVFCVDVTGWSVVVVCAAWAALWCATPWR